MSARDDVMKGKGMIGNFANDVEAHIKGEFTTLIFGETFEDGHCNAFNKITIPTKTFAKLGLAAFAVIDQANTNAAKSMAKELYMDIPKKKGISRGR